MATPEAIHCISCAKDISSHLETQESLGPIPLATQLQESKLCLDESFSSGNSCSNLLAIDTGDQKGAGEEHSKGYFVPGWKDGKNILFSVSYSSCLAANDAEARISSSDLRWWHTSMAADLVSWVWLRLTSCWWEFVGNCYT